MFFKGNFGSWRTREISAQTVALQVRKTSLFHLHQQRIIGVNACTELQLMRVGAVGWGWEALLETPPPTSSQKEPVR